MVNVSVIEKNQQKALKPDRKTPTFCLTSRILASRSAGMTLPLKTNQLSYFIFCLFTFPLFRRLQLSSKSANPLQTFHLCSAGSRSPSRSQEQLQPFLWNSGSAGTHSEHTFISWQNSCFLKQWQFYELILKCIFNSLLWMCQLCNSSEIKIRIIIIKLLFYQLLAKKQSSFCTNSCYVLPVCVNMAKVVYQHISHCAFFPMLSGVFPSDMLSDGRVCVCVWVCVWSRTYSDVNRMRRGAADMPLVLTSGKYL